MDLPKNRLKAAMLRGEVQIGCWLGMGSATAAEVAAHSGFDWCLIDGEHGPSDLSGVLAQLRAIEGAGGQAVLRVPTAEDSMLRRALDMGVQSVLVPMVNTAEDAARVAAACRYPPTGTRGYGAPMVRASRYHAVTDYVEGADDEICVIVQVETAEAVKNVDAIAAAPGVDAVFVGPADLAADMGHLTDMGHADVEAAIDHALSRIRAAGKPAGIITLGASRHAEYAGKGVTFLGVAVDVLAMAGALRAEAAEARKAIAG